MARRDDEIYEQGWRRRRGIEAYASHTSIQAGERLDVHVSTFPVNKYAVSIYRMGYYGGAGGLRRGGEMVPEGGRPGLCPRAVSTSGSRTYETLLVLL